MGKPLTFDMDDPVLARAAWSRIAEPGDEVARAVVDHLGAGEALRWIADVARGHSTPARLPSPNLDRPPDPILDSGPTPHTRLHRAVARWVPRLEGLDPRRELTVLHRLGGRLVVPGGPGWPAAIDDLGLAAPLCLWVRGRLDLAVAARRSVAVVGARACTEYGAAVAQDLAVGLADRHFAIASGGAYGIDAAAHRGALASPGPTIAFLAGGIDRLYPAGNTALLEEIIASGGAVVAEVPPGSVPSRVRFLLRNRLIAAFAAATVVIEAAWRSGSLSTAARAAELLRPVGAVPGAVTSMASAGCHRLLRETDAVCVTDAAEVAELAGSASDAAPEREGEARLGDGLGPLGRRLWDALPVRSSASVESVARAAGVSMDEAMGGLGHLELVGAVRRVGGGWRREMMSAEGRGA